MHSQKPRVLLVGIGGYGNIFLEELFRGCHEGRIELAGGVDPFPGGCRYRKELAELGVPVFDTLDRFYEEGRAELAIISSPIQFHREHTLRALKAGSSVLCEKPLAPTIQEALQMQAAVEEARRAHPSIFVAIGYQWSYTEQIQALKRDVMAGRFGRALRFKTLVCWPRPEAYFARNAWAGRIFLPGTGYVLDCPTNNAMAHYLHNMFYILGDSVQASAKPAEARAELYRANAIENYDTVAMQCTTEGGTELYLYATHAAAVYQGPVLEYEFEGATVRLNANKGHRLAATFKDGQVHDYGQILEYPDRGYFAKLWKSVEATRGGEPVPCTIESAMSQTICTDGIQRPAEEIPTFGADLISLAETPDGRVRVAEGLQPAIVDAFRSWTLPGDSKAHAWAKPARTVDLRGYSHFELENERAAPRKATA